MRRRRRNIILAVVAVLVLLLAAGLLHVRPAAAATRRPRPGAAAAARRQGRRAAPAVSVVVPGRQQVARTISATGQLAARRDMPVGIAGEGGRVVSVLVEPGQWVGAGQTLAVIDRSVQTQEAAQLAAQIDVARADARLAQQELDRAQALVSRGFVSKADVERRIATRDAANARVRVAQANLGRAARPDRPSRHPRARRRPRSRPRSVEPGQIVGAGSGRPVPDRPGRPDGDARPRFRSPTSPRSRAGVPAKVTPVGSARSYQGQHLAGFADHRSARPARASPGSRSPTTAT